MLATKEKRLKVLITRPAKFSVRLSHLVNEAGFNTELLPLIAFKPVSHPGIHIDRLRQLSKIDIVIFTSATAVEYGMPWLQAVRPHLPDIPYLAIGPATFKALQFYALNQLIVPPHPPFESETLLKLPILQDLKHKQLAIFRGNGGRDLLAQQLRQRGAALEIIECYRRVIPETDIANRLNRWHRDPPQIILATSAQCLLHLKTLVGEKNWHLIQICPIIVVGSRMQTLATTLGIRHIFLAKGADDASLMEALMNFRDNTQ